MVRAILYATLPLVALFPNPVLAQIDRAVSSPLGLEPGEYSVGFQLLEEQDDSRTVTGGISPSTAYPRPIRTYLWYPAEDNDDARPMYFRRYASLADEDIWPAEIAGQWRDKLKYSRWILARTLGPAAFESLLQRQVLATENAAPMEGPFPLVVIGQGFDFEFPVGFAALGEYLAGRGFVVATCPLVGTNSPFVRIDAQDLETQVRDLEFVITRARRLPFVSPEKLGVFGFNMGGIAGLLLTMRNPDVDAFVSVDAAVLYGHESGIPGDSPDYNPLALRVPWLHGTRRIAATEPSDSRVESLFENAIHSERYLLVVDGMSHFDFTSYALIDGPWSAAGPEGAEGHRAVSRYLSNFFAAFLKQDNESRAFLAESPQESIPGATMSLERRPAMPASITTEEFEHAVVAGQADQAIDRVRDLRENRPAHLLLSETYLQRLVSRLRADWGLTEEAMPVTQLWVELYPSSVDAQRMLAEGYVDSGDFPAAIEVYNLLLQQNPNDSRIRSRLEWLRSR